MKNYNVHGFTINRNSLKTLFRNEWLDDQVINGFFNLMKFESQKILLNVLPFDTFFATKLLMKERETIPEFHKWLVFNKIFDNDIWLIPINKDDCHWVLVIVILQQK